MRLFWNRETGKKNKHWPAIDSAAIQRTPRASSVGFVDVEDDCDCDLSKEYRLWGLEKPT